MKTLVIKNFLDKDQIEYALNFREPIEDLSDNHGVYGSNVVTTGQQWLDNDGDFATDILNNLHKHTAFKNNQWDTIQVMHARRAYDVHSDWYTTKNQVIVNDTDKHLPTYTVLMPLTEGNFSTVIFEQTGKYNNFSEYKKNNAKLETYISDNDWQKYCSHCHAEDQHYLTLLQAYHWKAGDLLAFDRTLFHCSAHFTTEKKAVVGWLSL
jgi:hypothetical protein